MQMRSFLLLISCAAMAASAASAHHSHAIFDNDTWRELEGTVQQVLWVFPHTWIYAEVEDEQGQVELVAFEASNPNEIREAGVEEEHLQPGDRISVRCHPPRTGSTSGCLLGFVTPMHGDTARGHGVERAWN